MALVTYELDDRVATITLNRPEARNAINGELRRGLNATWDRFRDDEDAWVGILTANGDVFCAGGDLKDGEGSCTARVRIRTHRSSVLRLRDCQH